MVGIITMKETIKEKATGCSSRISPRKNIYSAATSSVASDLAACLSTTSAPHEYFYQTGIYNGSCNGCWGFFACLLAPARFDAG